MADGFYYLHTNGDLIFKSASILEGDPNYFDSPFVRKHWAVNREDRECAWTIVVEALALGANRRRIEELKEKWKLTNEDAQEFAKRVHLKLFMDGDRWCAAFSDFVNLQESQVGFGTTALEAFADLAKQGLQEAIT